MRTFLSLTRRNIKLFFSDKGMFFTSLITPLILLVLYATFLGNVYRDSLISSMPEGITIPDRIADSVVAGQLISSILAVSCVTVAFCSNILMVHDKATGVRRDLDVTPVSPAILSLSYYFASFISTLVICFTATAACLAYASALDSYIGLNDVLMLLVDVVLLSLFGTALSSIINYFLSTQGQISAVGSIISSCYGFICGAYMPISQFSPALQKIISFLPGTYGTSLVRNHAMSSTLDEMETAGVPVELIDEVKKTFDLNVSFNGDVVSLKGMYLILALTVALLIGVYVLINVMGNRKEKR